jgi:phospholipid/cholesterol/gamma-HCH transport system substrate-binding protein
MENKSNAFLAGVFTIGLAFLVVAAIFWFSTDHTVRVPFDLVTRATVSGLGPQADVKYRGLDVGKVVSIRFDPNVPGQIIVRISVDKNAPITRSTYATLGFQGVTGIAYVMLDDTATQDGSAPSPPLSTSAKSVAQITMRPGFLEELEKRGDSLLSQVESLMTSLNDMFTGDNRRDLMTTIRTVKDTADDISRLANGLEPAVKRLPRIADNLDATLASTRKLSQELARPDGSLLRSVDEVGKGMQSVAGSVQAAATSLNESTLPEVNRLARDSRQAVRSFDRAASHFNDSPQSVLFGGSTALPGPGEKGFQSPGP